MALNIGAQKGRLLTSPPARQTVYRVEPQSLDFGASVVFGESVGSLATPPERETVKSYKPGLRVGRLTANQIAALDAVDAYSGKGVRYGAAAVKKRDIPARTRSVGSKVALKKIVSGSSRLVVHYDQEEMSPRVREAVQAAFNRVPELLRVADQERADAIIKASIEAALPLQRGVREQAELAAGLIADALGRIPMLTAREVGLNAASKSDKPEGLAAQWFNRQQVFVVDLREAGLRYPAFQFQPESGKPWPSLAKVLPRLQLEMPALDLLLWFDAPHPALGHAKPADCLHNLDAIELALRDTTAPVDTY